MATIRLYRHPGCAKCACSARMPHRFDWLRHFEDFTGVSPPGPIRVGQIVVQDLRSGATFGGAEGFARCCAGRYRRIG